MKHNWLNCINVPYFIILLCLTPDDFTHQGDFSLNVRYLTTLGSKCKVCQEWQRYLE
jgi:hypothetical protein